MLLMSCKSLEAMWQSWFCLQRHFGIKKICSFLGNSPNFIQILLSNRLSFNLYFENMNCDVIYWINVLIFTEKQIIFEFMACETFLEISFSESLKLYWLTNFFDRLIQAQCKEIFLNVTPFFIVKLEFGFDINWGHN